MSVRNLEHVFHPKSVALIGASDKVGSVGSIVMRNIVSGGFEGEIWAVNPKHQMVDGRTCYHKVEDIPGIPDLAIIVTPPQSVPGLIRDLGEKGTRAAVVIAAGLNGANGLRQEMLIDRTRIGRLLAGFRDRPAADRTSIVDAISAVSQMIVDFPCLISMDINPLLADADGVVALDARIEIDPDGLKRSGPNPGLAIRPYPSNWARDVTLDGITYHLRPIRPDDVGLYPLFLSKVIGARPPLTLSCSAPDVFR